MRDMPIVDHVDKMEDIKSGIGKFDLGERNGRGDRLAELCHANNLATAKQMMTKLKKHQNLCAQNTKQSCQRLSKSKTHT